MTFDPKPLLKGLGSAANVAGQIATDKAINGRRVRSDFSQFDMTQGQLLENVVLDTTQSASHGLKRVPKGAIVLKSSPPGLAVASTTSSTITFTAAGTVTAWVI